MQFQEFCVIGFQSQPILGNFQTALVITGITRLPSPGQKLPYFLLMIHTLRRAGPDLLTTGMVWIKLQELFRSPQRARVILLLEELDRKSVV